MLQENWMWRLLPGCIPRSTQNRPPLKKRPVIVEQDYLKVFLQILDLIRSKDNGIHILHVGKFDLLFELYNPESSDIEIFGCYADIPLRSAGQSFHCLVFRKKTLQNLMRSFMKNVVSRCLNTIGR